MSQLAVGQLEQLQEALDKADYRSAEQERIIAKQREIIDVMRDALVRSYEQTGWCPLCEVYHPSHKQDCLLTSSRPDATQRGPDVDNERDP